MNLRTTAFSILYPAFPLVQHPYSIAKLLHLPPSISSANPQLLESKSVGVVCLPNSLQREPNNSLIPSLDKLTETPGGKQSREHWPGQTREGRTWQGKKGRGFRILLLIYYNYASSHSHNHEDDAEAVGKQRPTGSTVQCLSLVGLRLRLRYPPAFFGRCLGSSQVR